MSAILQVDPPPLAMESNGTVRVGGTRLTLDTVISAFHQGATAEQIAEQFPPVSLGDVYAVIAYYLRHPDWVETYLQRRRSEAESMERKVRAAGDHQAIRERLLARRSAQSQT